MQPEKWQQVEQIFHEALEVDFSARAEFLAVHCGNDPELRREVESLIAADAPNTSFLEEPALKIHAEQQLPDSRIGETFGHYKILEKIGAGGMGAIYLAERSDDEFQKRVAVKIIKRGMDSDAILRRFRQERQILAALEHPNIARLLDGGTTADGLPFLVMEYIEGVPVNVYCRENDLDLTTRLALFREICAAVQFAHQKLVVHRDLKPSNIFVTKDGTPKLLDFGIAKLLNTTDASETQTQHRVLTPAYASPEQLRGETVSTATDVYSLGLILREILQVSSLKSQVSSSKFQVSGSKSQVAGAGEERKVNGKGQTLPDDVRAIVRTATHEDTARRYGSAENLSEDIRRHLVGLPVSARKDTFGYRTGKFLRRNPVAVMAVTVIFLLLVGGILLVSRQARIAERERMRAERRAENLRLLSSSFAVELHDAILNLPGSLPARQLLLTRAVEQLDVLAAESDGNPQLQDELAQGYYNLSQLPNINLADVDQNAQKGIAIYQNLLAADPPNIAYRKQLAKGYTLQANAQKVRGDTSGALALLQKSMTILEAVVADDPEVGKHRLLLQDVEAETAAILIITGRARESLEMSRKALALGAELVKLNAIDDDFERMLAVLHFDECKSLTYLGDYQGSLELLRADWSIVAEQAAAHPNDTRFRYEIWAYQRGLALAFERSGDKQAAAESLKSALEIIDGLRKSSLEDIGYQRNTSFTRLALGQFFVRQNQAALAVPQLVQALGMSEKIFAGDAEKGETLEDLARIHAALGNAFVLLGKRDEGAKHLRESLGFFQKALDRDAENALFRRDFAETLGKIGDLLQKSLNPVDRRAAKDYLVQSAEIWQDLQNKGILSYADTDQPKLAAQNLAQFVLSLES
jgi:tRNA A-37 threonylcarbamoyl transferase component Bud32/tetratricopeptide (TPR) repeat protein